MTTALRTGLELEVESIAAGGDGVGRANGLVVFVPRTAPGDRARVRIESSKRFARGRLETLVRPAPSRIEPPCPHYRLDDCGGCQLQHIGYEAQLDAKSRIVGDAIERIGKRRLERPPVRPSERPWRYRTKLTMALRRVGADWIVGLHPYHDPVALFQLADCLITDEDVVATWREIMAAAPHLPAARELRGSVRLVDERLRAVVIDGADSWDAAEAFFAAVPSASALWWKPESGARRLVAARTATPAGASFAQVNPEVAALLRAHVAQRVLAHAPAHVVDAYAGTGDTALALAEAGVRVTAIELDADAAREAASRLPAPSRALAGRVEDRLGRTLPADVVVLNPPRAGLHERVPSVLERDESVRAVVYVSCNPATLARDLARLPSFAVASLAAYDMFPQTAHVETVCELTRAVRS
jgi:23S rRNA (uracil1939-C5)-methyltransferase